MYNDVTLGSKGFYGETVSPSSGMTVVIRSHGITTNKGSWVPRSEQHLYDHIDELNKTAILLIRNPFRAIIGHRNLDAGGHTGLANSSQFKGEGWDSFVTKKI